MTAALEAPFGPGDRIGDTPWVCRRVIGSGGMGCVLEVGRIEMPDFRAALKLPAFWQGLGSPCEPSFVNELELLTRFHHDNIVRVFDFGTIAPGGAPYFVMDLLEGPTLRQVMREAKRLRRTDPASAHPMLKPAEVWKIVREIGAGLDYAHARTPPIVHRDIKAENIVLHKRHKGSRVVILDFGVSQVLGTAPPTQGGTPRCFPPELLRKEPITPQADLYALGLLVYELLALRYPYDVDVRSKDDVANAHLNLQPVPLRRLVPHMPASVEAAIDRALSKDPSQRQAGVLAFVNDLSGLLELADPSPTFGSADPAVTDPDVRTPPSARPGERDGANADPRQEAPLPPSVNWLAAHRASRAHAGGRPRVSGGRRRMVALAAAAAVLALAAAGGWKASAAFRNRRPPLASERPGLGLSVAMGAPLPLTPSAPSAPEPNHPGEPVVTSAPSPPGDTSAHAASAAPAKARSGRRARGTQSAVDGASGPAPSARDDLDDVVFSPPRAPPNLDDIVLTPRPDAVIGRLGERKDPPPASSASIARHP